MTVIPVDPDAKTDDTLLALANNTRRRLDDLIGYVDVLPPKLPLAHIRTLQNTSKLLAAIATSQESVQSGAEDKEQT